MTDKACEKSPLLSANIHCAELFLTSSTSDRICHEWKETDQERKYRQKVNKLLKTRPLEQEKKSRTEVEWHTLLQRRQFPI